MIPTKTIARWPKKYSLHRIRLLATVLSDFIMNEPSEQDIQGESGVQAVLNSRPRVTSKVYDRGHGNI